MTERPRLLPRLGQPGRSFRTETPVAGKPVQRRAAHRLGRMHCCEPIQQQIGPSDNGVLHGQSRLPCGRLRWRTVPLQRSFLRLDRWPANQCADCRDWPFDGLMGGTPLIKALVGIRLGPSWSNSDLRPRLTDRVGTGERSFGYPLSLRFNPDRPLTQPS